MTKTPTLASLEKRIAALEAKTSPTAQQIAALQARQISVSPKMRTVLRQLDQFLNSVLERPIDRT